ISRLAAYSRQTGLGIRPHTKTHKSSRVASMQLEAGAIGLTVAKVGEAAVMVELCDDLLMAYPAVDLDRAKQLAALAQKTTVHLAIDSARALEVAAAGAQSEQATVGLLVDIDAGLGRTGLQTPQEALALAQAIDSTAGVRLDGIMVYPGHIWLAADQQGPALAKVAALLEETLELWKRSGLEAGIVSAGSTPTAYQSHFVPQFTEIRPGTYVYNDMNTVHGGYCELADCAARLVCTVMSTAVPGQIVIDAGSKTLTSDRCVSSSEGGFGHIVEYPQARIVRLSEEHGQVDVTTCDRAPVVGERVTVIPNHICPCVNLHDAVWWHEPGQPLERLPIDARGRIT
ncbi:MAG: alanine racemase, partial [Planctomycetales bacterium]|nr:alanine racemase [Planctomycetales bacterium]